MDQPLVYNTDIPATELPEGFHPFAQGIQQNENINPLNLVNAQKEYDCLMNLVGSKPQITPELVNQSAQRLETIKKQHATAADPMADAPAWAVNLENQIVDMENQIVGQIDGLRIESRQEFARMKNEARGGGNRIPFVEVPNGNGVVPSAANHHRLDSVAFIDQLQHVQLNQYLNHYQVNMNQATLRQKQQRLLVIIGSSVDLDYQAEE